MSHQTNKQKNKQIYCYLPEAFPEFSELLEFVGLRMS